VGKKRITAQFKHNGLALRIFRDLPGPSADLEDKRNEFIISARLAFAFGLDSAHARRVVGRKTLIILHLNYDSRLLS